MKSDTVKAFLTLCDETEKLVFLGKEYKKGDSVELEVNCSVSDEDVVEIDLAELGLKPKIGKFSALSAISVIVCGEKTTTIGLYKDPILNPLRCCYCRGSVCCVYGESGCSC